MNEIVGTHDIALITLDTLRYDVAREELAAGRTPNLAQLVGTWQERHSPGSFTYAAHAAFFAGFLPTPARPGRHPRLFALRFEGSETTAANTCVLDGASIVEGLAGRGYHTLCVGGVGFFNQQNPLGRVFPNLFAEAHWSRETGVTDPRSFEHQIQAIADAHARISKDQRIFTFLNVAALHQPNHFYLDGAPSKDTKATHAAALRYVDRHIPALFATLRRPLFAILCSDHGTLYGDDDFTGHRIAHPNVMNVPYAEVKL
ncbi:MAG: STM4013/SEN3800 family hydrolase [Kofleriaceae bacterium]